MSPVQKIINRTYNARDLSAKSRRGQLGKVGARKAAAPTPCEIPSAWDTCSPPALPRTGIRVVEEALLHRPDLQSATRLGPWNGQHAAPSP